MANSFANFTVTRDAILRAPSYGNGECPDLFVGDETGYQNHSVVYAAVSEPSGFVSLVNAWLYLRCRASGGVTGHDNNNTGGTLLVRRITSSPLWAEGTHGSSSDHSYSADNAVTYDMCTSTSTYQGSKAISTGAWNAINITDIVERWLNGTYTNYGLRLQPYSTSHQMAFYSTEAGSSYDPYIRIEYTTNSAPTAPTGLTPTGGTYIAGIDPTFTLTHNDADSDALTSYDLQVSTDNTFASVTHFNGSSLTVGITGDTVSALYSNFTDETALTRGVTYYWRARTREAVSGAGTWCTAQQFKTNALPVATLTQPAADSVLGKMTYTAGSGWTLPHLDVEWTFSDTDGHTQTKYELSVYKTSTGPEVGPGEVVSSATSASVAASFTESGYYNVKVRVYDGLEWSAWTDVRVVRTRWALSTHIKDLTGVPSAWAITTLSTTTTANNSVVMEYNSSTDGGTPPDAWQASLSTVTKRQYLHYRVWMTAWGTSPVTAPSLDELVITKTAMGTTGLQNWLPATLSDQGASFTPDEYYFGSECLRIDGDGGTQKVYQNVSVVPYSDYVLHGYLKTVGNSGACIGITGIGSTTAHTATSDWSHDIYAGFNVGSATSVEVYVTVTGASGTYAFFDGLKLERGTIASPWAGITSPAVTAEAGGLRISGPDSGTFQLIGTSGAAADTVELGAHGLEFGGDVNVYSDGAGELQVGGAIATTAGVVVGTDLTVTGFNKSGGNSFPASPSTDDKYYRTDLHLEFYYDGTRWLTTTLYQIPIPIWSATAQAAITASASNLFRVTSPSLEGGSNIWCVKVTQGFYLYAGDGPSGSHKWVFTYDEYPSNTTFATITVDSGSEATWRVTELAVGAALTATDRGLWLGNVAKTGTPGNLLTHPPIVSYRIVAT